MRKPRWANYDRLLQTRKACNDTCLQHYNWVPPARMPCDRCERRDFAAAVEIYISNGRGRQPQVGYVVAAVVAVAVAATYASQLVLACFRLFLPFAARARFWTTPIDPASPPPPPSCVRARADPSIPPRHRAHCVRRLDASALHHATLLCAYIAAVCGRARGQSARDR